MNALIQNLFVLPAPLAYGLIAALVFAEAALMVGFVLPGETAVFLGGVLAASGHISLTMLLAVVVVAAIVGDTVGYEVGRRLGPRLLGSKLLRRHAERLEAAQASMRNRGGWAVFFGRFTAFLRAVMPGLAGASGMRYRTFALFNAAGGILWGVGVSILGYVAGASFSRVEHGLGVASAVITVVFVMTVAFLWHRRRRGSRRTGETLETDDSGGRHDTALGVARREYRGADRALVIIPTYNEAGNIEVIVDRVRDSVPSADILVADDDSPDGTGQIADSLALRDGHVMVLHRAEKAGLGAAYLAGFAWGIGRAYEVLVEMDADGSHRPEELPRLLDGIASGADLVIGSRWVEGGKTVDWPRWRMLLSRGGNAYIRLALGLEIHDATAGYRAFRRSALESLQLADVDSRGYCFQVDLTRRVIAAGLNVREVPITFADRTVGESKMSGAIVVEALWRVTVWGLANRLRLKGRVSPRRVALGAH